MSAPSDPTTTNGAQAAKRTARPASVTKQQPPPRQRAPRQQVQDESSDLSNATLPNGVTQVSDPVLLHSDAIDLKVLLGVLAQLREGDFTARMPLDWTGMAGKIADGVNDVI